MRVLPASIRSSMLRLPCAQRDVAGHHGDPAVGGVEQQAAAVVDAGGAPCCSTWPWSSIATGSPCQACSAVPARGERRRSRARSNSVSAAARRVEQRGQQRVAVQLRQPRQRRPTRRPMRASSSSGISRFRPMPITAQTPPPARPGFRSGCRPACRRPAARRSAISAGPARRSAASASAMATPTASGRPTSCGSAPSNFQASEKVRLASGADSQLRPARPRPAVWLRGHQQQRAGQARRRAPAGRHWSSRFRPPLRRRRLARDSASDGDAAFMAAPCAACAARARTGRSYTALGSSAQQLGDDAHLPGHHAVAVAARDGGARRRGEPLGRHQERHRVTFVAGHGGIDIAGRDGHHPDARGVAFRAAAIRSS